MRMTRDAYAREVWKVIEAVEDGKDSVACPHENCEQQLRVLVGSIRTGAALACPEHGVIYREA